MLKLDWNEFMRDKSIVKNDIINYILNEKNRLITKDYIRETLAKYGITHNPKDLKLYEIAMTHTSYIKKDWFDIKNFKMIFMGINVLGGDMLVPIQKENIKMAIPICNTSYERLEFLGDSIIRLVISEYLFMRYQEMQEGSLTKLRSRIENGSSLAEMTRKIGLNKYALISRNYEVAKARDRNEKIQCDIFEAFIAALYLDSCDIGYDEIGKAFDILSRSRDVGYQKCYNFITSLIEDEIDLTSLLENDTNYKDRLLQVYHELNWGDPLYGIDETIIDNTKMGKKFFKMYVRDNNRKIIGIGVGSSKQKGEKLAAKKALQYLDIIPIDNENEELKSDNSIIYHKKSKTMKD